MEDAADRHDDAPAATQYEIMRDAGFKHLEHADEDDRRATQRLQQKSLARRSNRPGDLNHAAENGILESIECINFMCHKRLHVSLGPLLNFIVGENGSGKSAVLTAITLCLGAKASSTNRGGSLKNFIKEGADSSALIVKIKNQGRDAYQHDIYGDVIIVERHFNRNGGSGFRLKSQTGKIVSDKKSEVDQIVEYYCLQVDNPLNILSQDNARQFLNQASAKQKYKFFLQGVQLQQLDDDYRVLEEYAASNEHKEGDLETKLEHAQKEYEKSRREYEIFLQAEDMRKQCRLLSQKAIWAQVAEAERKTARNEAEISQADGQIAGAQHLLTQRTQELEIVDSRLAQAEEVLRAIREDEDVLKANVDKAQRDADDAQKDLHIIHNNERDARTQAQAALSKVEDYEERIQEEERRLQDLNGDAHSRKIEELEAAQARQQEVETESENARLKVPGINQTISDASKELQTIDKYITQKQDEIKATQNRIKELERGQESLYAGYEHQVPDLLRMVQHDAGFDQKPIGPIGAHVQVKKPVWSPILERTFGETLNGFIVTSKRDQQRLRDMMKKLGLTRCPIFIANTRPIDTSRTEPDENFDTILRILKIGHPLIRSQLIINHRIEQTILVETKQDADRIMVVGAAPPRNVAACIHLFRERGFGWGVRVMANANRITSSPIRPPDRNQKPRLRGDSLQETSVQNERVKHLELELRELRQQRQKQQQVIQQGRHDVAEVNKTVEADKQRLREIKVEIDEIQQDLDSFDGADGRLEVLREDLKKAQEDYDFHGGQYGALTLRKVEQNKKVEELRVVLKGEKKNQREFDARLAKAEDKVKRCADSRSISVQTKNEAHDNLRIAQNEKARLEGKRERLEETVREYTQAASEACPERAHVGEGETYEALLTKYESLRRTLKERERRRGTTDEQVISRANIAKADLEQLKKEIELVKSANRGFKDILQKRLGKWRSFQRYISSNSRANFMFLLSERDFRGRLILDHSNHTLEVQVEPDKTRKNAAARNTKTLSGGEKSFSSICLLLAIWEAMGSPLRCLDEFDVFMDNVNRAISTNMLVSLVSSVRGSEQSSLTHGRFPLRAARSADSTY
jgi:structural maintenance of chromosomes protein 6